MAKLYIVATPIGNLEDITLRALRVLKEVDLIACEDTRVTKRLLDRYEISDKQLMAYNEKQSGASMGKIISILKDGKDIALVSDSGTPTISDPGNSLIRKLRYELPDTEIVPVPGASALITALSVSGLLSKEFVFFGFLPHKKGRETLFKEISASKKTVVFYESPHRIMKSLQSLEKILTDERDVVVARELTKIYEQVISGAAAEVYNYFEKNPEKVKGEFVVVIGGKK